MISTIFLNPCKKSTICSSHTNAGSQRTWLTNIACNNITANFPGFYNSNHTADRFSASRISFMHDFPETRGSQL